MNRYFFALSPSKEIRNNILFQRDKLHTSGKLTDDRNIHMTLVFLGKISIKQVSNIIQIVTDYHTKPFEVVINKTGYFKQSRAFWLGPEQIPSPLIELHEALQECAQVCKIPVQEKKFKPHITLSRKGTFQ